MRPSTAATRERRVETTTTSQPRYYVAKTFIGSDPDYLPLLDNISMMARMNGASGAEVEAFLIMDKASINLSRTTPHPLHGTYFNLIQESGCRVITIQELIDTTISHPETQSKARATYTILQNLAKFNLSGEEIEMLPISLQADFAKVLFVHGFTSQHPDSINICMDLDLIQRSPGTLPPNPADFLKDSGGIGFAAAAFYSGPIHTRPELQAKLSGAGVVDDLWHAYCERIKRGKTHGAILGRSLATKEGLVLAIGTRVGQSSEYLAGKSKLLPVETSVSDTNAFLHRFMVDFTNKVKALPVLTHPSIDPEKELKDYLQKKRKADVDALVYLLCARWQSQNPDLALSKIIDPATFGICGRCDIEKWKDLEETTGVVTPGLAALPHIFFSPNITTERQFYDPWSGVFEQFCTFARKTEKRGGAGFGEIFGLDETELREAEAAPAVSPPQPKTSLLKSIATAVVAPLSLISSGVASCCRRCKAREAKPLASGKQKAKTE